MKPDRRALLTASAALLLPRAGGAQQPLTTMSKTISTVSGTPRSDTRTRNGPAPGTSAAVTSATRRTGLPSTRTVTDPTRSPPAHDPKRHIASTVSTPRITESQRTLASPGNAATHPCTRIPYNGGNPSRT